MTPREILEDVMERPLVLYHKDPVKLERLLRQALGKFQDKAGAILEVWGESGYFEIPANFQSVAGCCDSARRYVAWRFDEIEVEEPIEEEVEDSVEEQDENSVTGGGEGMIDDDIDDENDSTNEDGQNVEDDSNHEDVPQEITRTPDEPLTCFCAKNCKCHCKDKETINDIDTANIKKVKVIQLITKPKHVAPYCMYYFCDLRNWALDEDLPPDCPYLIADYLEALLNLINTQREREAYLSMGLVAAAQELPNATELKQRIYDLEVEMQDNKALIPPASSF